MEQIFFALGESLYVIKGSKDDIEQIRSFIKKAKEDTGMTLSDNLNAGYHFFTDVKITIEKVK